MRMGEVHPLKPDLTLQAQLVVVHHPPKTSLTCPALVRLLPGANQLTSYRMVLSTN